MKPNLCHLFWKNRKLIPGLSPRLMALAKFVLGSQSRLPGLHGMKQIRNRLQQIKRKEKAKKQEDIRPLEYA